MTDPTPVFVRTLPNGLTVLLREAHDAPLVSFWIWYRVGSRNEVPGLTGISHWVEHMQFKGTPSIAKGAIFRDVSKHGGTLNALTSHDWTAYFETLPADQVDLSLSIEADRMANSLFDPEETESERTVILAERQGGENNPTYLLYEELIGAAFRSHPYRHMVIGYENDLRAITRDDLFAHYRRYYRPNNAFIAAAGDFDAEELSDRIEAAFGKVEAGPEAPLVTVVEPPQRGERRVTLRRPAPTAYLRMAFRAPEARHVDTAALLVADAVLSGGKPMGLGGGGPMGRSARLYRALVASGLARSAGSDFGLSLDPYLFTVGVTALPDTEPERIECVVDEELQKLAVIPVPEEELARALKQVTAQYVYSGEGVTNQAFWLGLMEIVDGYGRADALVDELARVTPDDVRRVAKTYFTPESRTVGWLLPTETGAAVTDDGADDLAAYRRWFVTGDATVPVPVPTAKPPFERTELANGIVLLGQAHPGDPTVSVRIRLHAGAVCDPDEQPGLATFTGRTLIRGTSDRTFEAFNEATDGLGATLGVDPGREFVDLRIRCLREDLPALLDLAADVLLRPAFPDEEVEKVRNELFTAIREFDNDTRANADLRFRQILYPVGHPYRRRAIGDAESIAAITRDDLKGFHAARYGPHVMTVAIVGGFASLEDAARLIEERFGAWDALAVAPAPVEPATPPAATVRETAEIPGKSQADLALGGPTLSRLDPDYYALDTANLILGRLGLMGRLGANVRDLQGLAYYVYSAVEPGLEGGLWVGRAGVDPGNVERTIESIIAELRRLRDETVTAEELADAKSYLIGSMPLALETNDGVAGTLLGIERYDLGLDYLDRYPGIIAALTAEGLQAAARRHLDPDRLAVGVAGPA